MKPQPWLVRTFAAALICAPIALSAQSSLAAADASTFLGGWAIDMQTPQGAFTLNLSLTDKSGKIAGEISADMLPTQEITDISKSGEELVLKYASEFQGQSFNVKITMTVEGEKGKVTFDAADGQFVMEGAASKNVK
jgi:hypothetical protein